MITSTSNPRVKELKSLQKAKERRSRGVFIIEGLKEIEKAILSDYQFNSVYYCPDLISKDRIDNMLGSLKHNLPIEEISTKVYNQVAYRENSGGLIVCAKPKTTELSGLKISKNPLILVVESVEKPGNLGALLRTADAAGVNGVIVCDPHTDIYNPNVIRASIGSVFTTPLVLSDSKTIVEWLKNKGIKLFCTALSASKPHYEIDFTVPSAIVMGSESTGLTDEWLNKSDQNIIIPMHGAADSMNVSTSAAVIVFEAIRQRSI